MDYKYFWLRIIHKLVFLKTMKFMLAFLNFSIEFKGQMQKTNLCKLMYIDINNV